MNLILPLSLVVVLLGTLARGAAEDEKTEAMKVLMEFDGDKGEPRWVAVNDGVMGGLSEGGSEMKKGSMSFTGKLSLENNGGFSSVRTIDAKFDFSGKAARILRVKGDGRKYQIRLSTDARYNGSAISYGAEFETEKGKWTEVKVPFKSLAPSWRGRNLDGPPLDLSKVEEIGILIGDKKAGDFSLEVDRVGVE